MVRFVMAARLVRGNEDPFWGQEGLHVAGQTVASPRSSAAKRPRLLKFSDLDISQCEHPLVISLKREISTMGATVLRPVDELAVLDLGFPVRTPELVLEQLVSIEPVLDVRTIY